MLEEHQGLLGVTQEAALSPFTTKSDYARENATDVALAASLGFISTIYPDGIAYSNTWRATIKGLSGLRRAEWMTSLRTPSVRIDVL